MSELVDRAEAALRGGRSAEARGLLERALAGALPVALEAEARSMLGLALVGLGHPKDALSHLQAAVAAEPDEAMFRYNLGCGLSAAGDTDGAVAQHQAAVRLAPGMAPLVLALAQAQMQAGNPLEARTVLERLDAATLRTPVVRRLHAGAAAASGDTHAALDLARRLLPDKGDYADPQARADAMTVASLAHAAQAYEEAQGILAAILRHRPDDADAATVLAQLLMWTEGPAAAGELLRQARAAGASSPRMLTELLALDEPVDQEVERLAADSALPPFERADLLLAMAQRADRAGDAARAWDLATRGKGLLSRPPGRDWRATVDRQRRLFAASEPVVLPPDGPQHLYLLGTPRSGQSLVQSILAAAPGVTSVGERGALLQHLLFQDASIETMAKDPRAALLRDLAVADGRGLARVAPEAGWIVDKSPLHLAVAGLVARVHPAARFAAVLRDPADVAVSIFLRRFPPVYDYADDFAAVLDHLDFALDAIAAWRAEGLDIHLVDFDRFLDDPAASGAALFDWLGLAWNNEYLEPSRRTEPVPTYSALQVRQKVGEGKSRGAAPYASMLEPFAQPLAALRAKQAQLFAGTA
ncbi:sulfotransferase [Parerythrobacter aurantius]|uniref:tetratricopeptide repeat-containing sulfotransferase family protein n=1 Tax=Parerythrobacter aurantius TaxID=3127706 RepID=UPI0032495772